MSHPIFCAFEDLSIDTAERIAPRALDEADRNERTEEIEQERLLLLLRDCIEEG